MHVTGLGQCSLDYLSLVEEYPKVNTKQEVIDWHEQGGGPVATALVTLTRLGISCSFCGITGDDEAGRKIRQSLEGEGIEVKGLLQRDDSSSQTAFIAVEKNTAKRTIFWRRPSGKALQPDELAGDFLCGSDLLLIDGLMMEASLAAVDRAREMHIPVLLDAGSARPGMFELARRCDYVVASEVFAEGLGWELTPQALLDESEALGVMALTVTRGEEGSLTAADGQIIRMPAFKVKAVDTTGAGDVFHGGYIFGLLQGWDIERVVRFASAVAAIKCRNIGGRTGIPRLDEVTQFLQGQDQLLRL